MKILLTAVGTQGDMEPFLAIGEMLEKRGHSVTCAFPAQFEALASDTGLPFESLGSKFIELLNSDTGKAALGGSARGLRKILAIIKLARRQKPSSREMIQRQDEIIAKLKPDRIIHNGKAIVPLMWEVEHERSTIYVSPVPYLHYVKDHSHVAFNSNYGEFLNKLTFKIADWGLIKTVISSARWLGKKELTKNEVKKALRQHKIIYTISPSLFSRPPYWPKNMQVLGYKEREKSTNWSPDPDLEAFIAAHDKILFVTFGSMLNPYPEEKTRIILDVLQDQSIPAIINTAAGGLIQPHGYRNELVYFVSSIPYDWILPRVYAAIHHGGSGTTHLAIKYGCPTLIIPHIIDQFVWNKMIFETGIGPLGIQIGKINQGNIAPKIMELMHSQSFFEKTKAISEMMLEENFEEEIYQTIIN